MTNVFFLLVDFNSRADITTRYTFNQIRCFFYISYRFHGLMGYTSKIYTYIYIYIYIYIFVISVDISGKRVLNTLIRKGRAMISYRNYPKLTNLLLKVLPHV